MTDGHHYYFKWGVEGDYPRAPPPPAPVPPPDAALLDHTPPPMFRRVLNITSGMFCVSLGHGEPAEAQLITTYSFFVAKGNIPNSAYEFDHCTALRPCSTGHMTPTSVCAGPGVRNKLFCRTPLSRINYFLQQSASYSEHPAELGHLT